MIEQPLNKFFHKPVFIMAAPRSGSTLLFEILVQAPLLWTIGDESHALFESIAELRPGKGVDNNRLTGAHASEKVARALQNNFLNLLRDRNEIPYVTQVQHIDPMRMLEKTPKNALRIPFLNTVFPDSLFIYLYRDPRENISSIMESWRSGRFVTYPDLLGKGEHWSLLLPPNWLKMRGKSLEAKAAFQWKSANQYILDDLEKLAPERWTAITYADLLTDPEASIQRLCKFIGVPVDEHLRQVTRGELPLSRFTLSPPQKEKWRKNINEINSVLPGLQGFIRRAERLISQKTKGYKPGSHASTEKSLPETANPISPGTATGRNSPCPCGSGKKYKRCHGSVS